jgi:hypothetical protein
MADTIHRSHYTIQHIVERHEKGNRLTGRVRKSASNVTAHDESRIMRQILNNPK